MVMFSPHQHKQLQERSICKKAWCEICIRYCILAKFFTVDELQKAVQHIITPLWNFCTGENHSSFIQINCKMLLCYVKWLGFYTTMSTCQIQSVILRKTGNAKREAANLIYTSCADEPHMHMFHSTYVKKSNLKHIGAFFCFTVVWWFGTFLKCP